MKQQTSISYQRKNQLLLLVTAGFGLLAFLLSIRPTIDLYQDNSRRRQGLAQLQQAPRTIEQLQRQTRKYAQLTRSFQADSTRQEGYVLDRLTQACRGQGVTLAALLPSQQNTHNGYRIETRVAKLRGHFTGPVQVLYILEYKQPIGRLSSVRYVIEEDRKQRKSFLFAYVYLQHISTQANALPQ